MEENTYYEYRKVKLRYRGTDFICFLLLFYDFMEKKICMKNHTKREATWELKEEVRC